MRLSRRGFLEGTRSNSSPLWKDDTEQRSHAGPETCSQEAPAVSVDVLLRGLAHNAFSRHWPTRRRRDFPWGEPRPSNYSYFGWRRRWEVSSVWVSPEPTCSPPSQCPSVRALLGFRETLSRSQASCVSWSASPEWRTVALAAGKDAFESDVLALGACL